MEHIAALAQEYSDLNDPKAAASFLSAFLKLSRPHLNPKSPLLSEQSCSCLISDSESLHSTLKTAHRELKFEDLDSIVPRIPPVRWESNEKFAKLQEYLHNALPPDKLDQFVQGTLEFKKWQATAGASESIASHVQRLGIFKFSSSPSLLLFQLGSFMHDPILRKRIDSIFRTDAHTFLVNVSASGKTRLLFEGLCLHWGFYFTSVPDTSELGSSDMDELITAIPEAPGFHKPLRADSINEDSDSNRMIVQHGLSELLLSRLLVFKMFIQRASTDHQGLNEDHKRRWLLLQLRPGINEYSPESDIFDVARNLISSVKASTESIENAIMQTLDDISQVWDISANAPLFVILDEANRAVMEHLDCFHDDGGYYSILKEIVRSWAKHLGHLPVSFIVAGITISHEQFVYPQAEWLRFNWCSNTGAFDSPLQQRNYVSTFLPPEIISSSEGEWLFERLWRWLRSRHRFTAAFISIMLQADFNRLHMHLTNEVYEATGYDPTDWRPSESEVQKARTDAESKRVMVIPDYHRLSMDILEDDRIRALVHEALLYAICHTNEPRNLGIQSEKGRALISAGQGRYVDESMTHVAVDEPLVLTAIFRWFIQQRVSITDLSYFKAFIITPRSQCTQSHKLDYLSLYLATAFTTERVLSEVFNFAEPAPAWSTKTAQILTYNPTTKKNEVFCYDDYRDTVVATAANLPDLQKWIRRDPGTPFCLCTLQSQTTLLFALRLSNRKNIWVALQLAPICNITTAGQVFTVDEDDSSEITKALKMLRGLQAQPGILRIHASFDPASPVVPPSGTATTTTTSKSFPYATLNMEAVNSLTQATSQTDILDRYILTLSRGEKRKAASSLDPEMVLKRNKNTSTTKAARSISRNTTPPPQSRYNLRKRIARLPT